MSHVAAYVRVAVTYLARAHSRSCHIPPRRVKGRIPPSGKFVFSCLWPGRQSFWNPPREGSNLGLSGDPECMPATEAIYSATELPLTRFFLQKCSGPLRSER
jgi:hypothetical protein